MNFKIERINHMIREEVSKILMLEIKDEDIKFVTVTDCDTSNDLSYAKIYVTNIPELKFYYDESINYGEKIDKIIDEINEGENGL